MTHFKFTLAGLLALGVAVGLASPALAQYTVNSSTSTVTSPPAPPPPPPPPPPPQPTAVNAVRG